MLPSSAILFPVLGGQSLDWGEWGLESRVSASGTAIVPRNSGERRSGYERPYKTNRRHGHRYRRGRLLGSRGYSEWLGLLSGGRSVPDRPPISPPTRSASRQSGYGRLCGFARNAHREIQSGWAQQKTSGRLSRVDPRSI